MGELNDDLLAKVRAVVEHNTRRPSYLASDEEWDLAVDVVLETEKGESVSTPPICPHCGSVAPYGDERIVWISMHIDSKLHRWWCNFKRKVEGG